MQLRTLVSFLLGLVIIGTTVPGVHAQSINDCEGLITALRLDTQAVQITSNNAEKDRASLVAKLNESAIKLDQAKFCDSVAKLNDFKARVQQLAAAGKISLEDGDELSGDADSAIACVVSAAASAGVACAV